LALGFAYDRVHEGMTETEVQDIIGTAPGWYSRKHAPRDYFNLAFRNHDSDDPVWDMRCYSSEGLKGDDAKIMKGWGDDEGALVVVLDSTGRVASKTFGLRRNAALERFERRNRPGLWNSIRNTLEDIAGRDLFADE
jgi:hypothetical protein